MFWSMASACTHITFLLFQAMWCIGHVVHTPWGTMLSRAVLVLCSLDLSAKSIVLNMKQFKCRFACNFCEHEGVSWPSSYLHRNWPYQPDITPRTHKSFMFFHILVQVYKLKYQHVFMCVNVFILFFYDRKREWRKYLFWHYIVPLTLLKGLQWTTFTASI